jgi:hypothetical protein
VAGKQIDFPPKQKQIPGLDRILWIIAIVCIVLVILAIFLVEGEGGV